MIVVNVLMALLGLASLLGLVVLVRHCQLTTQLAELDQQIETLEVQLDLLQRPDYFVECELTSLIRKQNEIREKMFF